MTITAPHISHPVTLSISSVGGYIHIGGKNAENRAAFFYAPKKNVTFTAPIFVKLMTPERHYVAVICAEFHAYPSTNMQSTSRSS